MQIYWIILSTAFLALLLGIAGYYAFGYVGLAVVFIACIILAIWQIQRAIKNQKKP